MRSRRLRRALLGVVVAACAGSLVAAADAAMVHFKSPSGNINCFVFSTQGGVADCIVRHASWPHPPQRPKSCDLDCSAPNGITCRRTTGSRHPGFLLAREKVVTLG